MFEHILAPLDGSPLAECALPHVAAVARASGARVTLLQALERTATPDPALCPDPLGWYMGAAEARAYLDNTVANLQAAGLRAECALLEGQAAETIIRFIREKGVDLVILSSHGRSGLSGWNVSSVVLKTILRAYIPAMIVRAYQAPSGDVTDFRYRRLLVPLDCSQRAECVLPPAVALARFHQAELLAVHVTTRPQMACRAPLAREDADLVERILERNRQEASKYLRQLSSQLDVDIETRLLVSDHAAAALHDLAEEAQADLVVLSAHGYSGSVKWPYGGMVVNFVGYGTTPLLIVQDLSPGEVERTRAEMAAREQKGH